MGTYKLTAKAMTIPAGLALGVGMALAVTAVFFGGQYQGMGVTALMVLCGSVLVILLAPGGKNRAGCRRRKKHG